MNHKEKKYNSVTIIETKKDALDFSKSRDLKSDTFVITFSQEAEYILKYKHNIKTTSIWKIFNYDYIKFEKDSFDTIKKYFSSINKNIPFLNLSDSYFYNQYFMDSFLQYVKRKRMVKKKQVEVLNRLICYY